MQSLRGEAQPRTHQLQRCVHPGAYQPPGWCREAPGSWLPARMAPACCLSLQRRYSCTRIPRGGAHRGVASATGEAEEDVPLYGWNYSISSVVRSTKHFAIIDQDSPPNPALLNDSPWHLPPLKREEGQVFFRVSGPPPPGEPIPALLAFPEPRGRWSLSSTPQPRERKHRSCATR